MTKILLSVFTLGLAPLTLPAQTASAHPDHNCFSIVVGKKASADGSVLFAHNEDDGGEQFLNWYIVERETHGPDARITFHRGGSIAQAPLTHKYLWLELPKMQVSDTFLNEHGVVIASDGCPSREDREDYTDGGIVYELRRLAAERATSASQAVDLMGEWIERYGYADSGRSYVIADQSEGWVLCVVRGRHWAAARVPDDHLMALANTYTLDKFDPQDTANYRGAKDLISYAQSRGWYDPQKDGRFSFKKAFGNPGSETHPDNVNRQWAALTKLTGRSFPRRAGALPFSTSLQARKISLNDLFEALAFHYEATEIDPRKANPKHQGHPGGICHDGTQYGVVAQLRSNLPPELGALLWIAPYHPCSKVFVPWYVGMTQLPQGFSRYDTYQTAIARHLTDIKDFRAHHPEHRYWRYVDSTDAIAADYPRRIEKYRKYKARLQRDILAGQAKFEAEASLIQDPVKRGEFLNAYTQKWVDQEQF